MTSLTIEYINVDALTPNRDNARVLGLNRLIKSRARSIGLASVPRSLSTITISSLLGMVAGSVRKLKLATVPAARVSHLTDVQRRFRDRR